MQVDLGKYFISWERCIFVEGERIIEEEILEVSDHLHISSFRGLTCS